MQRFVAVMVPLAVIACVHTRQIPPAELANLDGFGKPGVTLSGDESGHRYVTLQDVDGEPVTFSRDSRLRLLLADGRSIEEEFRVIEVREGALTGTTGRGPVLVVPLQDVRGADVSWFNGGFTALVTIGGLLGTLGLATAIGLLLTVMFTRSGRVLRIDGKAVVAAVCENHEWVARDSAPSLDGLSPRSRAQLAGAWLADAQAEHASVAAFSRLSSMLLAVGAPPELIAAAHRAALEEIDHARRTFALASAYAGRPLGPAPLPELLTASIVSADSGDAVSKLAVESLVDGCLNEGVAAALAAAARDGASDPAVLATLDVIAKDEASHRELAWDIVAWCARVSDRAREDIVTRMQRLPREARFDDCAAELACHGRLRAARQREIFQRVRGEVLERAQQLLGTGRAAEAA